VFATPLVARPGDSTIYSDLGEMTLGKLAEKFAGARLDTFLRREFFDPLRMSSTTFIPDTSLRERIAPTEIDSVWRKKIVRGTVHDENAAFLGGVSGHAGLFSTSSDLAVFMQMLLNRGVYAGRRYISEGTLYDFIVRKTAGQERWLGWDMRSPRGSSAGTLFSSSSFGHTGFTGTSIWADPERNLAVIFLTNRVYPTRANTRLYKIRPALHDAVIQALGFGPDGE
jgi:CubicO group peptidase (beta-lactamase class C family)